MTVKLYLHTSECMHEIPDKSIQMVITNFNSPILHLAIPKEQEQLDNSSIRREIWETFRNINTFLVVAGGKYVRGFYEKIIPEVERVLKDDGVLVFNTGNPEIKTERGIFEVESQIFYPYAVAEDLMRLSNLRLQQEHIAIFDYRGKQRIERWFVFSKTDKWKENKKVKMSLIMHGATHPVSAIDPEGKKRMLTPFSENTLETFINRFSNEGDIVLDPCGGTGTVGIVSDRMKRNAVLYEYNGLFFELLLQRLENCNVSLIANGELTAKIEREIKP